MASAGRGNGCGGVGGSEIPLILGKSQELATYGSADCASRNVSCRIGLIHSIGFGFAQAATSASEGRAGTRGSMAGCTTLEDREVGLGATAIASV